MWRRDESYVATFFLEIQIPMNNLVMICARLLHRG